MRAFVLGISTLLLNASFALGQVPTSPCADTTDGAGLVVYVQLLMTRPDSDYVAQREQYELPLVGAKSISLASDEEVCKAAATAYSREVGDSGDIGRARRVNVIRVGDKYVVQDPYTPHRLGEWSIWFIFDSRWQKIAGIGS